MSRCPRNCDKKIPANIISRRAFFKSVGAAAAGLFLAGCGGNSLSGNLPTSEILPTNSVEPTSPFAPRPVVAIAKADSYDRTLIRRQVETMLDSIGGISDVLSHGNSVAIKTNLTGGIKVGSLQGIPEIESFMTHPEVVRATAELLRDAGVRELYIVEAVYEKESWAYFEYLEMAKEIGATLVDLNFPDPFTDFVKTLPGTNPFVYDNFMFHAVLDQIDAFVSISKMKCHNTCGVTHSMKNLVGLVPYRYYVTQPNDHYRSALHGSGDATKTRLPQVIMDLNAARPINLAIIDGVMTTEAGEGPWVPMIGPIQPGVLFAGKDSVATDAVATAAMGFDPTTDFPHMPFARAENHLNIAAELGLGNNKIDDIDVVGKQLMEVTVPFRPSF